LLLADSVKPSLVTVVTCILDAVIAARVGAVKL